MEQLSGVMIIIIIGGGVMTFVMLFIFAKRQIMRFTLRSRRGPHVPVGNDAKKGLRREIERRLEIVQKIVQEPILWTDDKYILQPDEMLPPYYYRMKAVDDVKTLEKEIASHDGSIRHPYDNLRAFLLTTLSSSTLNGAGQRMIHQFCDMYEHARHDPNEFASEEYEAYHRLLLKLIDAAKHLKSISSSLRTSPARTTPKKQTKMHSLLDPSRLRPPPLTTESTGVDVGNIKPTSDLTAGQHSKVNLTLGLQGRDHDTAEIPTNPLYLQPQIERDAIIRNRIKTPTLDDVSVDNITTDDDDDGNQANPHADANDIMNIAAVQNHPIGNSSVV